MFELPSALGFALVAPGDPIWRELNQLKLEHHQLLVDIETRFQDFSDLNNRFHRLVNAVSPNRFIDDFYDIITFIFHYHYQWSKRDERQRNETAIREHLAYIEALVGRDRHIIEAACRHHLASGKTTLLRTRFS